VNSRLAVYIYSTVKIINAPVEIRFPSWMTAYFTYVLLHLYHGAMTEKEAHQPPRQAQQAAAAVPARSEALRVTQSLIGVIEAFLDAGGGELHGYAIIKSSGLGGPTVYKILERMTEMGWVTARWQDNPEDPNKPRRRYYKMTSAGMQASQALVAERRQQKKTRPSLRPAFGGGHL
jgi:PadR family transcriptional regulator, regulatory protein PadR